MTYIFHSSGTTQNLPLWAGSMGLHGRAERGLANLVYMYVYMYIFQLAGDTRLSCSVFGCNYATSCDLLHLSLHIYLPIVAPLHLQCYTDRFTAQWRPQISIAITADLLWKCSSWLIIIRQTDTIFCVARCNPLMIMTMQR